MMTVELPAPRFIEAGYAEQAQMVAPFVEKHAVVGNLPKDSVQTHDIPDPFEPFNAQTGAKQSQCSIPLRRVEVLQVHAVTQTRFHRIDPEHPLWGIDGEDRHAPILRGKYL